MKTIIVKDLIGKRIAFSDEDAEKVYIKIVEYISEKEKIRISFKDIDMLISRFLNVAIGRLYKTYQDWEVLDQILFFEDLDPDDKYLLVEKVIPTAKVHFLDIERSERIEKDILK